ncbi:MAG: ATP-binding protein, partial [Saprospiraceae bacterium]|nr:ATP-binding protein [Saprospiraceae bacterium]
SNQELERFAYIASHDLKGPLRAINSFINLIDREIQPLQNKKLNKYLRFVSDGTLQMNTLIKEVLEFSTLNKKKELENTNVNLNDTLEQITESLQIKYEQPIKIQFDQMPVLTGNPSLFFQLFFNLIENGLKYNKAALPQVWIKVFETTDYFEFQVKDNGIGIDPKHQQQVFEMFSRLHHQSAFQGTGIGLAICKKVVHLYHGTIRIESELEKGTTVFFTIRK